MVAKKPKKKYRTLKEPATHGRFDRDKISQVIDSLLTEPFESMKDLPTLIKKLPKLGKDVERFKEDIQESLALKELLDRSKKSLTAGKIEPLKDVMNDIRARAKQLKSIPKYVSGKTDKTAKTLKDLKGNIRELPKLGKDAEQFLKDIRNVKKLAGKYNGVKDLAGKHDDYLTEDYRQAGYHDLDHLAGTWSEKDAAEFQKNIEGLESFDPRPNRASKTSVQTLSMKTQIPNPEGILTALELLDLSLLLKKAIKKCLPSRTSDASLNSSTLSKKKAASPVPSRYELMMKRVKLLGRIDAEVHDSARANRALSKKWHEFVMSLEYKKERPDVKAFLGLSFAVRELGESEDLSDLIEIAIKTAPLFLKRFGYYGDTETAVYWFKNPQPTLKGAIPWMIMHTEYGRRRVRKAMTAEFGSHLMEVLQETVTGLHKIGLISTKDKNEILKGKLKLGIRP